jgi:pimeloyl-ACP methyl ester carboxylesterase
LSKLEITPLSISNHSATAPSGAPIHTQSALKCQGASHELCQNEGRRLNFLMLVMHGDDDQIVPYADSAPLSAKLLKNGTLKTYKGFPHGMPTTQAEIINADLLAFSKS